MLCESKKCIKDASQIGTQKRRDLASSFHGGVRPKVDLTKHSWVFFPVHLGNPSWNSQGRTIHTQSGSSVHGTIRPKPQFHSTFQINSTTETVLIPAGQRRADLCQGGDTGQTGPPGEA